MTLSAQLPRHTMMKILYTSGEVHKAIKQVLANGQRRRVAVVAYLGENAEAFLPAPKGLEIICSPEPGATSPRAVRSLISRGADVQFADDLHAKVYWSESGCVITSANASSSALGRSNQKEAGVLVDSAEVDIERLVREVKPYKISKGDMNRLDMQDRKIKRALGTRDEKKMQKSFVQWYKAPFRESWKIGWWCGSDLTTAKSAKQRAKQQYDVAEPEDALNVTKSQVQACDWLLCFEIADRGVQKLEWMFADFIVPVDPRDKSAYQSEYPFQAIQVHKKNHYPTPPFDHGGAFKVAFSRAIKDYGLEKITNSKSLVPRESLLNDVVKHMERIGGA